MSLTLGFQKKLKEQLSRDAVLGTYKDFLLDKFFLPLLTKISGVEEFEELCDQNLPGLSIAVFDRLDLFFQRLKLETRIHSNNCNLITKKQYIVVSNHPTGILDGCFVQKIFNHLGLRGKIMGDDIMCSVEQISDAYTGLSLRGDGKSRIAQLRTIKKEISNGLSLGLFPSGSVTRFDIKKGKVRDINWNDGFIEMAKSNNLDIVPVYIDVKLSFWHYFFKAVHKDLASLRLFKEALKFIDRNQGSCINIYIGNPIEISNLEPTKENAFKIQNICENLKYQTYSKVNE